uniref:Uncharacterized protein LOC114335078 n=1 Tax=Diabrotica virgifera virgifera TaxID=50390 RepID=A0A6P7G872_DIAVI
MEESALAVVGVVPNSVNVDELFDERSSLLQVLKKLKPKWTLLPKQETPNTHDKWQEIFEAFSTSNVSFTNIFKIVELFIFCLPGTSALTERIFSMMNFIWTAERERLSLPLKELVNIKANSVMSCSEFHDKIKNDKPLLRKIMSSEKYERRTDEEHPIPGPSTD